MKILNWGWDVGLAKVIVLGNNVNPSVNLQTIPGERKKKSPIVDLNSSEVGNVFPRIWPASTNECAEDRCCKAGAGDGNGHVQSARPLYPQNLTISSCGEE